MHLIGLTGGIASGKSVVADRLAGLGAVHVDADQLARQAVEPGSSALADIVREFGPAVVAPDGSLDRAALGAIIFTDPDRREALNAIVHPAVKELARERIRAAAEANPDAVIVYDVPLLVEAGVNGDYQFDLIVVVHASTQTRIKRMVDIRGMSREEATHRLNSQATDTERMAIADVVINNDGTLQETLRQVDELWQRLTVSAR